MFMTSALSGNGASYVFEGASVVERGYPQPDYLTIRQRPRTAAGIPDYLVTHKAVPGQAPGTVPAIHPHGVVVGRLLRSGAVVFSTTF